MTEGIKTELSPGRQETTRAIDTAMGILVGWRGCSTHSAFRELINVSARHRIPIFALAEALVTMASGTPGLLMPPRNGPPSGNGVPQCCRWPATGAGLIRAKSIVASDCADCAAAASVWLPRVDSNHQPFG
ncbi:MAG: ANTAR domain-containing protein [Mycobacterium sp.]